MAARHWTGQRRPGALIEEMIRAGEDTMAIVDELGVSEHTVRRIKHKLGLTLKRRKGRKDAI